MFKNLKAIKNTIGWKGVKSSILITLLLSAVYFIDSLTLAIRITFYLPIAIIKGIFKSGLFFPIYTAGYLHGSVKIGREIIDEQINTWVDLYAQDIEREFGQEYHRAILPMCDFWRH